jgi:hypothetical protein
MRTPRVTTGLPGLLQNIAIPGLPGWLQNIAILAGTALLCC